MIGARSARSGPREGVDGSPPRAVDALLGESRFARCEDGRRLHYRLLAAPIALAEGKVHDADEAAPRPPVVIWISGLGMSGVYWAPLHRRLGTDACLGASASVIYDRAGLGRSDDDPGPRTLARLADDLLVLIDALTGTLPNTLTVGGAPHFVLAGHSWGGPVARVAASRRPGLVAGMMLIDPSDEHLRDTLHLEARPARPPVLRLARSLSLRGLLRKAGEGEFGFDPEVIRDLRATELTARAARANAAEHVCFAQELGALRGTPLAPSGAPVTLISGTAPARSARGRVRREAMIAAHELTAARHPEVRFVRAERAGHLVNLSEPELVLLELAGLLSRTGRPR